MTLQTLTSFADPVKIRFRLSVDNLLLAKFDEVSPVFDPFSLLREFSEAFGTVQSSLLAPFNH